ncbi:MAG: hypothetical protein WBK96_05190 [Candidatus Manganitrophaceae bacterium]
MKLTTAKRFGMLVFFVTILSFAGFVRAQMMGQQGMMGGQSNTGITVEVMKKFEQETHPLRDELMKKQLELQSEYSKPVLDTNRIGTLSKEVIDLQVKIQLVADKYGFPIRGTGDGMMGPGMMGPGMMGPGMMGPDMMGRGMMGHGMMGQGMMGQGMMGQGMMHPMYGSGCGMW